MNCYKYKHSFDYSNNSNLTLLNYRIRTWEPLALDKQNPNRQWVLGSETHWTSSPQGYSHQQHRCICPPEPSKTYRPTLPQICNISIKYLFYFKEYFLVLTICNNWKTISNSTTTQRITAAFKHINSNIIMTRAQQQLRWATVWPQ